MAYTDTSLWKNSLGQAGSQNHTERAMLIHAFEEARQKASSLVSQIPKDIPHLTVHDISHLDALWETASIICGPTYRINCAEAFVLGMSILLHDAAMCLAAYPGGLSEVKKTTEWQDNLFEF